MGQSASAPVSNSGPPAFPSKSEVRGALSSCTPLLPPLVQLTTDYVTIERDWARASQPEVVWARGGARPFGMHFDEKRGRVLWCNQLLHSVSALDVTKVTAKTDSIAEADAVRAVTEKKEWNLFGVTTVVDGSGSGPRSRLSKESVMAMMRGGTLMALPLPPVVTGLIQNGMYTTAHP
jgi:hypothetical protein